jgi:UDP-glucose 4-epimerase
MNILITGDAGFIGSHLAERLLSLGHVVRVVDDLSTGSLDNIEHLTGDTSFRCTTASILDSAPA